MWNVMALSLNGYADHAFVTWILMMMELLAGIVNGLSEGMTTDDSHSLL